MDEYEGRVSTMKDYTSSGTGALWWGVLFGLVDAGILIGASLLGYVIPLMQGPLGIIINIASFAICLFLCGYAGYMTVKKSGLPASGYQAGFYVGGVSGVISGILALVLLYMASDLVRRRIPLFVVGLACMVGAFVVVGLVAGAIGGKLAQGRA